MGKKTLMSLAFEDNDQTPALGELIESDEGLVAATDEDLMGAHDDSKQLDELISTTEVLEGVQEAVQDAAEQGGFSPAAAKALDVAIEHFEHTAGLTSIRRLSLESFAGGRTLRIQSTKVALEEIGETIRRVIRRILEWIKHIASLCFDLIERSVRGANAVAAKAELLYKVASAMSHQRVNPSKLQQIEKSSLISFFNEHGKPLHAREIAARYDSYSKDINVMFGGDALFQPPSKALRALDTYVQQHGEKAVDLSAVESFAAAACEELVHTSLRSFSPVHRDGADLLAKELPFGNAQLLFSFAKGHNNPDKRVGFNVNIEVEEVSHTAALEPLSPQDVMNLMTVLHSHMGKGIYHDSKKIKAAIREIALHVEKQSEKLSDRQRQMGASIVPTLQLIRLITDSSMKLTRLAYSYSGVTGRRMLSYAEASLQAYHKARIA